MVSDHGSSYVLKQFMPKYRVAIIFFSRLTGEGDFDSPQMFLSLIDVAILVICQKFVSVLKSRKRKQ